MKLGAEPKKVAVLGGLLLVAVIILFTNSSSTPGGDADPSPAPSAAATPAAPVAQPGAAAAPQGANRQARGRTSQEFRPSLRRKRGEDAPDPMTIDPTLRLDVLAKLQQVEVERANRNIFEIGAPPPPPQAAVKAAAIKPVPSPLVPIKPAEPAPSAEPPKAQAPPIPLKFYGYVNPAGGVRRAFFIEGEDIHVVHEGDVIKRRYKVVRIGVNSVVIEDTQFSSQQTLPLEEQQQT